MLLFVVRMVSALLLVMPLLDMPIDTFLDRRDSRDRRDWRTELLSLDDAQPMFVLSYDIEVADNNIMCTENYSSILFVE